MLALPPSDECFDLLSSAYAENHRHYHTPRHIESMLRHMDTVAELAEHPAEVELAIWFHDAVYRPFSSTNELDSAKWAHQFLSDNGFNKSGIDRVYNLIMATRHHCDVVTRDEQLLVDIDLSILGAPADIYDQFEQNVRKEYQQVPSIIFRKKRKEILKSFLSRDSIYYLTYFREKYEQAAKLNLERAIVQL